MQKNANNGQNSAATSAVNVKVVVGDLRNNGGNYKWQINAVNVIKKMLTISGLNEIDKPANVDIIVQASEIVVKAEFNGKTYHMNRTILANTSKTKIKDIISDMHLIMDMIDYATEKMKEAEEKSVVDAICFNEIREYLINMIGDNYKYCLFDDDTKKLEIEWGLSVTEFKIKLMSIDDSVPDKSQTYWYVENEWSSYDFFDTGLDLLMGKVNVIDRMANVITEYINR